VYKRQAIFEDLERLVENGANVDEALTLGTLLRARLPLPTPLY